MILRTTALLPALYLAFCAGVVGCKTSQTTKEESKPEVGYVHPTWSSTIQDQVEYTGRTAAVAAVDIKARVTGFLKEVNFKEGSVVRKGQQLFLVDPEPYIAQYEQAKAQVELYKAQVELTTRTYQQAVETKKKNPETFSELQLRTYAAQMDEAKAQLHAAEASLKIYSINKDYTQVTSPIDGVVGRINLTVGNVVVQDQTLLTTVVALDPLYVYFDMDAPTFSRFDAGLAAKKGPTQAASGDVFLELPGNPTAPGEPGPQVKGTIDFFNNQFNPATDTLLVRGRFINPKTANERPLLRPGMFVRVRLPIGQVYKALLVPDRAVLSKMGKKYVYLAGDNGRVKEVPVVIGQPQEKALRVIKEGQLTENDKVIVTGLLDLQPNQEVRAIPLPSPGAGEPKAPAITPTGKNGKGSKGP
jgi:multidrug efflux system membrane fusion protein